MATAPVTTSAFAPRSSVAWGPSGTCGPDALACANSMRSALGSACSQPALRATAHSAPPAAISTGSISATDIFIEQWPNRLCWALLNQPTGPVSVNMACLNQPNIAVASRPSATRCRMSLMVASPVAWIALGNMLRATASVHGGQNGWAKATRTRPHRSGTQPSRRSNPSLGRGCDPSGVVGPAERRPSRAPVARGGPAASGQRDQGSECPFRVESDQPGASGPAAHDARPRGTGPRGRCTSESCCSATCW